jgi:two-component system CAI-1 autoinducer sensor kinase/phosphatase CqsS
MALSPGPYRRLRHFLRLRWWALRQAAARFEDVMFTRTVYLQPKMMVLSLMGSASMLLYYPVWKYLLPQPYENLALRAVAAALLLPLACLPRWPRRLKPLLPAYWYAVLTFVLPFFIGYMTLRNGASAPWLMTHLAALFLGMMLVDLASFALIFGVGTLAAVAAYRLGSHGPLPLAAMEHYVPLLLFALFAGPAASLSQHIAEQNRIGALTDASNNIAHELRTPLGSLRIAGQAVRRFLPQLLESHRRAAEAGLPVPELRQAHLGALAKSLDVIDHEVTHANTVIDMLLLAARPIGQARFEPVRALAIVEQALERYPYASRAERERVSLATAQDFGLLGAETLLVHVVFNLLRNALFHTGRAGKGKIELHVEADAREGRIRVYDTGPGIPPDVLPRIFTRFYSFSDNAQGPGGLGIGLSFSQAAVRGMGGEIRCRSRWGEFTEFVVAFPVAPGARDP